MWPAAVGVASVTLPWIEDPSGSRLGLSQPDGLLTVAVGLVAVGLAARGIKIGWIVSGFAAVVLGRNLSILLGTDGSSPGIGLWLGAAAFAAATAFQGAEVIRLVRSRTGGDEA